MQAGDLLARVPRQLRVDPAGQHRVDLNVVPRPGGSERFCHLDESALARRIRGGIGRAENRKHRADVDDLAAAALLHHRMGGLRTDESAGQVGVEHRAPFGRRVALRRLADRHSGIVDEDVEPAEALDGLVDRRAARILVGDIERDG